MNISLRQLRTFLAVARHRSFSRAGDAIGLSQPAVSHALRELEGELGLKLLDRTTRDVALTEAGQSLAGTLERLLDELEGCLAETRQLGETRQGRVRVAASPTISANLMPSCIARSSERHPKLSLTLRDQVQQLVLASVRSGEVDFGVIIDPLGADDLYCETILQEPFCLVCRGDHRFAGNESVAWSELAGEPLVLLDYASGSRPLIDKAFAQQQVSMEVAQELGHSTTVYRMIEAGIGISVLPILALPLPEASDLVVRPLTPAVERSLMLVRRKNRSLSPLAETVWTLISEVAAEFAASRAWP
ncbi:LysR family transcriptional regulator [Pseudogulbenkiania subflava]|uniref:DNA-binding transcriptional regulator, LysR family n=1 Tax=Pseudogulbenkiania subflava DSM 22618 TaxID=1123014 RepID=A0A1Y6BIF4_9NEIS|nr:LysR family transcriptional regulator [Pseudogulbenkiania subflava]SMF05358.1 DNA-binding transcriptional regulator, LysR family [Pseudogulbenkiania subflava DSM 22618]